MRASLALRDTIARLRRSGQLRGVVAACAVGLIGAGFSARATFNRDDQAAIAADDAPQGYEAEEHFPGAAYYFAVDQDGSQPTGTTGTTALPDAPPPPGADAYANDPSIHPAKPFVMAGASAQDRARALQCLTTAIYYEAAREPDEGQRAVAQVILNRVRHPAFPSSVCGVVYQGSERSGCQFSFACDGSMARVPDRNYWLRAARVASDELSGQVFAAVGEATHYHTFAVTPSWNRSMVMTAAIGAHFFHRWQGAWGTPAAFIDGWHGPEPLPQPHAKLAVPVIAAAAAPAAPETAKLPSPQMSERLQASGTPVKAPPLPARPAPAAKAAATPTPRITPDLGSTPKAKWAVDQELPESTILDRWKDSGRPKN